MIFALGVSMKRINSSLLAAILAVSLSSPVMGAVYNFSPLTYPGARFTGSYGLNDSGHAVGEYFVPDDLYPKGFIYEPGEYHGTYTAFNIEGAISTTLNDINNAGDLVGSYGGPEIKFPFLYSGGQLTPIIPPGATKGEARSINNSGVIVGDCEFGGQYRGWQYVSGTLTFIDHPGDGVQTRVLGINDQGTMVGQIIDQGSIKHGFILKSGNFETLDFPGALATRANSINNSEQVAGFYSFDNIVTHGFVYANGFFSTVDVPGESINEISRINRYGQIVGYNEVNGFLGFPANVPPFMLLLE
jgi:hypothetical protein